MALPLLALGLDAPRARGKAGDMLDRMGLSAFTNARPDELSGGMRQRCFPWPGPLPSIPNCFFSTKPFTGLDPELRASMRRLLDAFLTASGAAALHVTHDIRDIPAATRRSSTSRPQGVFEPPDDMNARMPLEA